MNATDEKDISLDGEDLFQFKEYGIPITSYLIVLCIVGTIGNLQVIVVYLVRYQSSIYKTFILCLATVDLLGCAFSIPFTLINIRYTYNIPSSAFCRLARTLTFFSGACSLALLDVIAVERYRKVCQLTRTQFTLRIARIVCACVIGTVFMVVGVPITIIHGINRSITRYYSLNGYECSILVQLKESVFVKIYFGAIFVMFIMLLVINVVLYTMVGRTLYKHQVKRNKSIVDKSSSGKSFTVTTQDSNSPECFVTQDTDTTCTNRGNATASSDLDNEPVITVSQSCLKEEQLKDRKGDMCVLEAQETSFSNTKETSSSKPNTSTNQHFIGKKKCSMDLTKSKSVYTKRSKSGKSQFQKSKNITMIFLVVSMISFGGYLPNLIVTLIRTIDPQMYYKFAHSQVALDLFIRWMIYLNNAINPLVYGLFDKKFRGELLILYKKVKNKACCKLY